MSSKLTNKYHLAMDKDGKLYQLHTGQSLMEAMKHFGVKCYFDDFYILDKNTIGLKKHLYNDPNWDPVKFKQFILERYVDTADGYFYLVEDQIDIQKDKIVNLNKFVSAQLHYLTVAVEIPEDDELYDVALESYRSN